VKRPEVERVAGVLEIREGSTGIRKGEEKHAKKNELSQINFE
jgi:hypothetical protein